MSWIGINDAIEAIRYIIDKESPSGPLNRVAPNPLRHAAFTKTLGQIVPRPPVCPSPAFVVRVVLGEMADELLFARIHVVPQKLLSAGCTFSYPDLTDTLQSLLDTSA